MSRRQGQATTEYVLLMAALVAIIVSIGLALNNKVRDLFQSKVGGFLMKTVFNQQAMHALPFRIPK